MTELLDDPCAVCGVTFATHMAHVEHRQIPICDRCDPRQYEMRMQAERKREVPRSAYP